MLIQTAVLFLSLSTGIFGMRANSPIQDYREQIGLNAVSVRLSILARFQGVGRRRSDTRTQPKTLSNNVVTVHYSSIDTERLNRWIKDQKKSFEGRSTICHTYPIRLYQFSFVGSLEVHSLMIAVKVSIVIIHVRVRRSTHSPSAAPPSC